MYQKTNSMRFFIITLFILLIIGTFSIIGYFIFTSWKNSAQHFISDLQYNTNITILQKIEQYLNTPAFINEDNHFLLENEIIDLHNNKKREIYFASIIKSLDDDIYSFSYGTETGEYYGARKTLDDRIESIENNETTRGKSRYYATTQDLTAGELNEETEEFDPRTRDWYMAAKKSRKPIFSPIYKHFIMNDLAITAAYPIYDKANTLKGVLGTHITLATINSFLEELVKNSVGTAYIVEKDSGYLVANSLGNANFEISPAGTITRNRIEEIDNQAIIAAYQQYKITAQTAALMDSNNDKLSIQLTSYQRPGLDWIIITAIPESPFMADITKSMHLAIMISILAIIIAIIIYMKSTEILLAPIYDLIKTTERFSAGDFSQRAKIYRNDEIGNLSTAFNNMAEQLYGLINSLESNVKTRTLELEQSISELKNSQDNIHLLLDSTAEAIYGIDLTGHCTFCNASCLKMLKYQEPKDLINKNMHLLIHYKYPDGRPFPQEECNVLDAIDKISGIHVENEVFWRSDGTCFPVEYFSYPQYRDGKIVGAVITFLDITARKKSEAEILYLSYRDQLTGLYNRRFFEEELLKLDTQSNLPFSIIMADMNGLKLINDSLGHVMGDKLLKKLAEVLRNGCRDNDLIARLVGMNSSFSYQKQMPSKLCKLSNELKISPLKNKWTPLPFLSPWVMEPKIL